MIRTERLLLRRWRELDREPFAAMNADPLVMEHMQGLMSRQRSDDFLDRIEYPHLVRHVLYRLGREAWRRGRFSE
jgi:hypothetical protein